MDLTQREAGTNGDGMFRYRCSFIPNGNAAPTLVGGKYIASVTRSATGLFLITFRSQFAALLGFSWGVREATGAALAACTIQLDPATTIPTTAGGAVIGVRTCTASTGASADFTASTVGAQIDLMFTFGTDPSNLV